MNISPKTVNCDENNLWVELNDGRTLGVPLAWFPRLLAASPAERAAYEISPRGTSTGMRWTRTFQSRDCWQVWLTSVRLSAR